MADRTEPDPPHPDVAGYLFGLLEPAELAAFQAHLGECPECAHAVQDLRGARRLLDRATPAVVPPADLERRVLEAVALAPDRAPQSRAPVPARPAIRPPRTGRAGVAGWAAAAVAVVVAALAGFGVGHAGLPGLNRAPSAPSAPQPAFQTVRLVAADGSAAGGLARIQPAPGGHLIELTVQGLAPSPPGSFYVCWLVGPGDTLGHPDRVSVGSFTVSQPGPVTLRWETAADLARYPHLGVTLEPDNGNPAHQGPKVLSAA